MGREREGNKIGETITQVMGHPVIFTCTFLGFLMQINKKCASERKITTCYLLLST